MQQKYDLYWQYTMQNSNKLELINTCDYRLSDYRPFAESGHMVRNKLYWDANNAVGLPGWREAS